MPIAEAELYSPIERFLHLEFAPRLQQASGTNITLTSITAKLGPSGSGRWTRPDLAMVNLWRYKYQPERVLDLYGFEVKRDGAVDVTAVHETLAHTRLVHFAYLVWHLIGSDFSQRLFEEVKKNCSVYGLGLITLDNVDDPSRYIIHSDARRATPHLADVDEFIETRFTSDARDKLIKYLRGPI